jgi:hypothetical protein
MRKRPVPVSQLADFAADPEGFEARRGGPRSASAARKGIRHHDSLGKPPLLWPWYIGALLLLAALIAFGTRL